MVIGNWSQNLWKSSHYTYLLSHLSSPEGYIIPWLLYGSSLLSVRLDVRFASLQCFLYLGMKTFVTISKMNHTSFYVVLTVTRRLAPEVDRYLFSMSSSCPIGCRKKTRELNEVLLIFLEYQQHSWRLPFTTQSPESPSLCSTTLRVNISICKSWGEALIQAITRPL